MWRTFKILFFLWPVPILIYFIASNSIDKNEVDAQLNDANEMVWKNGGQEINVTVQQSRSGELKTYKIILLGNNKQIPFNEQFTIDEDMFGGGFVSGVQADDDPNLELLVWGSHEQDKSYLLNYTEGKISTIPYQNFPQNIKELTEKWHMTHVTNNMALFLIGLAALAYYLITIGSCFIVILVKRMRVNKK